MREYGPAGVAAIAEFLKDGDSEVRKEAAFAFGNMSPMVKAAVPPLIKSLKDRDHDVRAAIIQALANMGPKGKDRRASPYRVPRGAEVGAEAADALGSIGPAAKAAVPR